MSPFVQALLAWTAGLLTFVVGFVIGAAAGHANGKKQAAQEFARQLQTFKDRLGPAAAKVTRLNTPGTH